MELYIRCTILPLWNTLAGGTNEAKRRGEIRIEFLRLAEEFEVRIMTAMKDKRETGYAAK